MRSVAIVGFAQSSLGYAQDSKADEMWTVNFAWDYAVPRIDRLFEIHPLWYLALQKGERDKKHLQWLQSKKDFPVYTYADFTQKRTLGEIELEPHLPYLKEKNIEPEVVLKALYKKNRDYLKEIGIPSSVPYPFKEAYGLFDNIKRGPENKPSVYLTSTISYMIALAILEKFDVIEIYGIELSIGSEYIYQKASTEALLMYAAAKGIEIRLVEHSKVLNSALYHEGAQMINRQALEHHAEIYKDQLNQFVSERNLYAGQLTEMKKSNAPQEKINEILAKHNEANNMAFVNSGAKQAILNAIKAIDLENPIIQLINEIQFKDPQNQEKQNGKPKRKRKRKRR